MRKKIKREKFGSDRIDINKNIFYDYNYVVQDYRDKIKVTWYDGFVETKFNKIILKKNKSKKTIGKEILNYLNESKEEIRFSLGAGDLIEEGFMITDANTDYSLMD